jgi:hypothetical protein
MQLLGSRPESGSPFAYTVIKAMVRGCAMYRLLQATVCVLLFISFAGAQTLTELAKKEKDRRAKNDKGEATKVITEEDLEKVHRPPNAGESSVAPKENSTSMNLASKLPKAGKSVDAWPEIFRQYAEIYWELKQYLGIAIDFKSHCEKGTPPPALPPVPGGYWILNCEEISESVKEIKMAMEMVEDECLDHARRLGVPYGRARLR